jgi:hypothetical protein
VLCRFDAEVAQLRAGEQIRLFHDGLPRLVRLVPVL